MRRRFIGGWFCTRILRSPRDRRPPRTPWTRRGRVHGNRRAAALSRIFRRERRRPRGGERLVRHAARICRARGQHALGAQYGAVEAADPTRAASIPRSTARVKALDRVVRLNRPINGRVGAGLGHDLLDLDDAPGGAFARRERAIPNAVIARLACLVQDRRHPARPGPRHILVPGA